MFKFKINKKRKEKEEENLVLKEAISFAENNNTIVVCGICDGSLLYQYAIKRKALRYNNATTCKVEVFVCKDCDNSLNNGNTVYEEY